MSGWQVVSTTTEFDDGHVTVVSEKLRTPSRSTPRSWTTVQRKSAVVIAPITREKKIVLIRQDHRLLRT